MEFLDPKILEYVEAHTAAEPEILKRLNRDTHAKVLMPRMLSGHLQGRVLSMFSRMIQPLHVLEIGTYTGYSAICLAEGLHPDGFLHTIDINEELEPMVKQAIKESGLQDNIVQHIGNALEIIPTIDNEWDLVFIDADKINYSRYYDLVIDNVKPGGFIIADNVLWSGKVIEEKVDKDTAALLEFNRKVQNDPRVMNVLFPVRDGLMVIQKLVQKVVGG
ncbi:MAG: O-methyltransferase [Sphingobacteriales bacterium]|nr:MAG: O-methyltransferase [Sphingobacteriales bacterium]